MGFRCQPVFCRHLLDKKPPFSGIVIFVTFCEGHMPTADEYRAMAARAAIRAEKEPTEFLRTLFADWHHTYLRLAEQAEQDARRDAVVPPVDRATVQQ